MSMLGYDSAVPLSSRVFPHTHAGKGANSHETQGLGVEASLGADAVWALEFSMPPTLPTGTAKLRLRALADAASGAGKVNPKTASRAEEQDPSAVTLTAEGTSTVTWAAGDDDVYKGLTITLDAVAPVGGEIYLIHLTFETTGWTLAARSTWKADIIWE